MVQWSAVFSFSASHLWVTAMTAKENPTPKWEIVTRSATDNYSTGGRWFFYFAIDLLSHSHMWFTLSALGVASTPAFSWPPRWTIIGNWNSPYANVSNPITVVHESVRQYQDQLNGAERI
jgi:hypothetical protein